MPALTLQASSTGRFSPVLRDDLTVAVNTEHTVNQSTEGNECGVGHLVAAYLYLYVVGANAGCSADVTFHFQASPDGQNWFDLADTVAVTLNGTTAVQVAHPLDLRGMAYLRLKQVDNPETTAGYTADVNAWIGITQGGLR